MSDASRSELIEAGALAYWGGVPRNWPPYDIGDKRRDVWLNGWDYAEREVMEAPDTVPMADVWREIGEPVA